MSVFKKIATISGLFVYILIPTITFASESDTRPYTNIPINQNFLALAYAYSEGDMYANPALGLEYLDLEVHGTLVAYAHTSDLFGNMAKFDVSTGYACLDGTADFYSPELVRAADIVISREKIWRDTCGMTDSRWRFTYNFHGAPALEMKDFVKRKKTMVVGASLQIGAPTGKYDKDYAVNVGQNSWFFKPEIGASFPLNAQWEITTSLSGKFFTHNRDLDTPYTKNPKPVKFQKEPVYNVQLHVIYNIKRGRWIAFDSNYFDGGHSNINDKRVFDREGNYRMGFTFHQNLNAQHAINLLVNKSVTSRSQHDTTLYGIAWSYRWADQ